MRICGVIASLGAGGAERVMLELCAAWHTRGHEVTLLTLDDGNLDFYAVPAGVVRNALSLESRSRSVTDALRANVIRARVLRAGLRRARPEVIVSFTDRTNVLSLLAARGMAIPVVVSERTDPRRHDIGRAWSFLRGLMYPSASALVVQTESVRKWANDVASARRVAVIPNPLRRITASDVPAGERAPEIVAIGRLVPAKGFDVLIRAFAMLADDFPTWRLTIFGEGPERSALQRLIDERGLTARVSLAGQTTNPDAVLAAASVFALPSRYEGFPNALLEAMSHGCACVATHCDSGPAEMLWDRQSGQLVPVDDVLRFGEALATVMCDDPLRTVMGHRAQHAIERFAADTVLDAWDELFLQVRPSARIAA